jgi:hypothetical protein
MLSTEILKKGGIKLSPGDIFEVLLKDSTKGYFQFIGKDNEYMAGHLVRAFDHILPSVNSPTTLEEIVNSNIKFYGYTRVFEGLKDGLWNKLGNVTIESNFQPPMFRQTPEAYSITKKSFKWTIFQAGSPGRKFIGELTDDYKKLNPAGIFPPSAIVKWIETGWHGFMEPE